MRSKNNSFVYFERHLKKLEASQPIDPDVQREILLREVEKEQKIPVEEEDLARIHYYRTVMIEDHHYEPFPTALLKNVKEKIPPISLPEVE